MIFQASSARFPAADNVLAEIEAWQPLAEVPELQ